MINSTVIKFLPVFEIKLKLIIILKIKCYFYDYCINGSKLYLAIINP